MMNHGPLTVGMAFQNRVSSAPIAPLAEQDFKDYQDARHQAGLTPDAKADRSSPLYKAAEKLLTREKNEVSQIVLKLGSSREYTRSLAEMTMIEVFLSGALKSLAAASTQKEIESAVKEPGDIRSNIAALDQGIIDKNLKLLESNKPLQENMARMYAMYRNEAAIAFMQDLDKTPLGSPVAAASPAATAAAPAKLPPVPQAGPVTNLNIPDSYETKVPDLSLAGSANADFTKRNIALRHVIGMERSFLLALENKNNDPSVKKQLKELEDVSPGAAKALRELTVKYKAVDENTAADIKLALSAEFRKRLSNYGGELENIANAKENPNTIALAIVKITKAADNEQSTGAAALDEQNKPVSVPTPRIISAEHPPTITHFPWVDKCRLWAFENGFVDTEKVTKMKVRDTENEQNPLAERTIFKLEDGSPPYLPVSSKDPVIAYKAVVAARIEIQKLFKEKPDLKYGQPQDFFNPIAKGINFITTVGFGNTTRNPNQAIDGLRDSNDFQQLMAKLRTEERELERYVKYDPKAQGEKFSRKARGADVQRENAVVESRAYQAIGVATTVIERAAKAFYLSTEVDVVRPVGVFRR